MEFPSVQVNEFFSSDDRRNGRRFGFPMELAGLYNFGQNVMNFDARTCFCSSAGC